MDHKVIPVCLDLLDPKAQSGLNLNPDVLTLLPSLLLSSGFTSEKSYWCGTLQNASNWRRSSDKPKGQ